MRERDAKTSPGGQMPQMPKELPNPPYHYQRDAGGVSSINSCPHDQNDFKDLLRGSSLMANR